MIDTPWPIRSRQEQGRQSERKQLSRRGAKAHPNSGAGSIKRDGSNNEYLYEMKDVNASHTIKGQDLLDLFKQAAQQGKQGKYVVHFRGVGITLEGTVSREEV